VIRLPRVRTGQGIKHKLMLKMAPVVFGMKPPDILYALFYRPKLFGKPMGVLHQAVLRGPSDWTVGEREMFAAWVSFKNRCRFCTGAHTAVAARAIGSSAVIGAILEGRPAPEVSDKARAILPFLEKLTVAPDTVVADDLRDAREAGVSEQAIADAIYVVMLFSTMNRMVDAIGCEPMGPDQVEKCAKMLLDKGYDM
jgi:uncharacterized peroxidase-related enzyme